MTHRRTDGRTATRRQSMPRQLASLGNDHIQSTTGTFQQNYCAVQIEQRSEVEISVDLQTETDRDYWPLKAGRPHQFAPCKLLRSDAATCSISSLAPTGGVRPIRLVVIIASRVMCTPTQSVVPCIRNKNYQVTPSTLFVIIQSSVL